MSKCSVVYCENAQKKVIGVPMFCFPQNPVLRLKWIKALKIDPDRIRENTKVCCSHFAETDVFHFSTKTKLKPGRVPHVNIGEVHHTVQTELEEIEAQKERPINHVISKKLRQGNRRQRKCTVSVNNVRSQFFIENFMYRDKKVFYYSGIPTFKILLIIFKFVLKSESGPPGAVHQASARGVKHRCHKLTPLNEFFLTLMKLTRGFDYETMADMFHISVSAVSKIFVAWINLLYIKLGSVNIFPHRTVLMEKAPPGFIQKYPNVVGSIDCTEFCIETPSSLVRQSQCFSHYKNTNTLKSLIMISATGAITFVSPLYTGSISDKKIMEKSGFLYLLRKKVQTKELDHGDVLLADKGFNVKNVLEDIGIQLNIPTFRITGMQYQPNEVEYIRKISHERIHVERPIRRLKSFMILSHKIPISLLGIINQIYTVCALVTNFRFPLRKNSEYNENESNK